MKTEKWLRQQYYLAVAGKSFSRDIWLWNWRRTTTGAKTDSCGCSDTSGYSLSTGTNNRKINLKTQIFWCSHRWDNIRLACCMNGVIRDLKSGFRSFKSSTLQSMCERRTWDPRLHPHVMLLRKLSWKTFLHSEWERRVPLMLHYKV